MIQVFVKKSCRYVVLRESSFPRISTMEGASAKLARPIESIATFMGKHLVEIYQNFHLNCTFNCMCDMFYGYVFTYYRTTGQLVLRKKI